jgi:hypothetical protein
VQTAMKDGLLKSNEGVKLHWADFSLIGISLRDDELDSIVARVVKLSLYEMLDVFILELGCVL